jgi:uncharacterized oxidoreductase
MDLGSQTVLITGGASGIGWALARRFLDAGSDVIICGRRAEKLEQARRTSPRLTTRVCDVAREADRVALAEWIAREHPSVNVLVNNAGIQQRLQLVGADWAAVKSEIAVNLEAPIHLSMLLAPSLARQRTPAIVNVTSGLAFVPLASVPIYCATKAAFHSFTLSLRRQLADTPLQVIEIIPPAVDTDLGGPGLHTFGVRLEEFADAAATRLAAGDTEITYGFAEQAARASRAELETMFARMNAR